MPSLYVLKGPDQGQIFHASDEPIVLGRMSGQIQLTDNGTSRRHAEIRPISGAWVLQDLNSSNGTYLNGERVVTPRSLHNGDQIKLGSTLLVLSGLKEVGLPKSGPTPADLVDMDHWESDVESSILSTVDACKESVILQAPETADAVVAWNIVYEVAEMIGAVESVEVFLERVADIVFDHLTVDRLVLMTCDSNGEQLTPRAVRYGSPSQSPNDKIVTSRKIIKHVLETRDGVLCANTMTDRRFCGEDPQDSIHRLGLCSIICVPIVSRGEIHGIVYLDCSMSRHAYTQEQLRLAVAIGRLVGLTMENIYLLESRMHSERMAAAGETVAHLSHYIRNILQGMQGGAEIVEQGLERRSLDRTESGWALIRRNLDRILQLTVNMLTFSKKRRPRVVMALINPVIEEVVGLVKKRAEEKSVRIVIDLEEMPPVPLDLDGIHQVVNNIVLNAVQAAPEGAGLVGISTRYMGNQDVVEVSINDNGTGIPKEDFNRIFDAFHSSKGHGGTGLGLAAASKIVRELRGTIEVESAVGRGTTFHIKLPLTPDDSTDTGE